MSHILKGTCRLTITAAIGIAALLCVARISAQTVVFSQSGFPTIDSEEISSETLRTAIGGSPIFLDVDHLSQGNWVDHTKLLVFPYGSAFPVEAWAAVQRYLSKGGSLLLLGGQPLRVPVHGHVAGSFVSEAPQDSYSKVIGFRHSYPVPFDGQGTRFQWRPGYRFLTATSVKTTKVFAQEGRLQGLGYLDSDDGTHLAAPVIFTDRGVSSTIAGARIVALPFLPKTGYWASKDGAKLIRTAARYASQGVASLQVETQYACLRPGELPQITLHVRHPNQSAAGSAEVDLLQNGNVLERAHLAMTANQADAAVEFKRQMPAGVYTVQAIWSSSDSAISQEYAENGFEIEELSQLEQGDALGVGGDFLTFGGKPFFPVGTNYFTTEENGWDFSGPRNAAVWEEDFADMQRHGVNFVRTGVWMSAAKFVEPSTGNANERFLRNLEAFLAAAHRHGIAVNFTFFAFVPRVSEPRRNDNDSDGTPPNPYLDRAALEAEKGYIASVVGRFGRVPWLSYDLINEPSFSNPRSIFHGNVPNGDPAEIAAWHDWLQKRYSKLDKLALAWRTPETQFVSWESIPLPRQVDLIYDRYGNDQQVRAFDYNLFSQDMFASWVRSMVNVIRLSGSKQLVNVGQDEGGVTNRVLNQFYAAAGVSFTTNHTYWQDDALLWDSVVAKRPGLPNITGETGYQPAWNPDGAWRYDELTGTAIEERKWALGFAAGSSGAMQWDWAREPDFGMQRSDGSAKIWEPMMRDLGAFATQAAPYATALILPEIAIVLPQSFQLSTRNAQALQAQQAAVRVLFQYDRVEAYAVGEYQIATLGAPKLIILPSAYGLANSAWEAIEARVRDGATLLVSGPIDADEHLHAIDRMQQLGVNVALGPLQLRNQVLHTTFGDLPLEYGGITTTILDRAILSNGKDLDEFHLGKGRVIFSTLPLELNSHLDSIAKVYEYALKSAGVSRTYTTDLTNPGILICPTRLPHSTLYVVTSETETSVVSFTDQRSGKRFAGKLEAGRAAILLVGDQGDLIAQYHWLASR